MTPIFGEIAKLTMDTAPILASAFLSPAAGVALKLVANAIGADAEKPQTVLSALAEHPTLPKVLTDLEAQVSPLLKPLLGTGALTPSSAEITIRINWQKNTTEGENNDR